MKKTISLSVLILCFICVFSQKDNSVKNYQKGSKALEQNKYDEAISLLTLSIQEKPSANAYYNRAVSYYYSGDTCSFCNDLKSASGLNDVQAENLFIEKCLYFRLDYNVSDSIKKKNPGISHYKKVYDKCSSDSTIIAVFESKEQADDSNSNSIDNSLPVFTIVEEMPSFPGGENRRNRFLAQNIKYPEIALRAGIQGTCYISFIINTEGSVTNVKVLRGIGGGCDEEAVRVVKLMPKWIPGRQNGKAVRVLFNMPIYFILQGKSK